MFSFGKGRSFEPKKPEGFEGIGVEGNIAFANAENTWEESFNLVTELVEVLQANEINASINKDWVCINNNLYLHPEIVEFQPLEPRGVRSVTTIAVAHEKYFPKGLFEFQHATGDDTNDALKNGFDNWIQLDLPVLIDAINETQETCAAMDMEFPDPEARFRRALLGPVSHLASHDLETDEEHPFCPCCLLTNSFDAFRELFEQDGFYGIRLLAMRDEDGSVSADCRVNGLDFNNGKEMLSAYAESWPDRGFEMRKQYVVIYTPEA